MVVPIGNRYSVKVKGWSIKPVFCQYCDCEYVYVIEREARGEATSFLWLNNEGASKTAADEALDSLQNKLNDGTKILFCPNCGMYSGTDARKLKREAWGKFLVTAASLIVITLVVLNSYVQNSTRTIEIIAVSAISILLTLSAFLRAYKFDPNAPAQLRKGRAPSGDYPVYRQSEVVQIMKTIGSRDLARYLYESALAEEDKKNA